MGLISRVSSRTYRLESLTKSTRVINYSHLIMPKKDQNIMSFFKPKNPVAKLSTTNVSPTKKISEKLKSAKLNESKQSEELENLPPSQETVEMNDSSPIK